MQAHDHYHLADPPESAGAIFSFHNERDEACGTHGRAVLLGQSGPTRKFTYGGTGKGYNRLQDALDHGVRPGISNDNASAYTIDMFQEMQVLYYTQRSLAQLARFNRETKPPAAVTTLGKVMLESATPPATKVRPADTSWTIQLKRSAIT